MAKKKLYKETYYSHLSINKTKRAAFLMVFSICYSFTVFFITRNLFAHGSWVFVVIPVTLLGIPLAFFPPVEEWVYKPWQTKPQKYERHYKD